MEMSGKRKADKGDKKKLLVTASTFPRWEDDTEPRFILDLSARLTEHFDVTALVPAAPGAREREIMEGVKVIRYHYFPIRRLETLCYPGAITARIKEKKLRALLAPFLLLSLWAHLKKMLSDYDIVHAHWLVPQGIVQSFFQTPYLVTGHGGDVTTLNGGLMRLLKKRCLQRASGVSMVSQQLCVEAQQLSPGLSPQALPMGVSVARFRKAEGERDIFGQNDKRVVLFVGRLAEKKGVAYLLKAMEQIDALLVIVGTGTLEKTLREQAAGLKGKVLFIGAKPHSRLPVIYRSADILAVPSVTAADGDQEGLPTVLLEAMASGLPVVASRTGGIGALIRDGETGLLCEEKNAAQLAGCINRLLNDEALRKRISAQAQEAVKAFDYGIVAQRYLELLNSCLSGSGVSDAS